MEEVIQKILAAYKESVEDWNEVVFASIKKSNPDADEQELDEQADFFDAYDLEWSGDSSFETWCGAQNAQYAYAKCLKVIFEALGKDSDEFETVLLKAFEEAEKEAKRKVKSGESKWLDDDPDESDCLNND